VTVEANKALVRRFYDEVWGRGNVDVCDEVFADDYIRHDLRSGDPGPGPEGQKRIAALFRSAFPDLSWDVEIVVGEGDFVVGRWAARGTHLGSWAGIAPSGRSMHLAGVNVFRFEQGKVAEIWNHRDDLGLMEQLGAPIYAGAPA
jgi:steroid delta-isomerase-like uncharacterized protein